MLNRVSVISVLLAILGIAMLVPCIQAATDGDWRTARGFLYPSVGTLFAATGLAVLLRPMAERETAQHELLTLLLAWMILPFFAAIPLVLVTPSLGRVGAWFDMVATLTTTGGTAFPHLSDVPNAIHLWRGITGWLGGLLTLMAANVVLAPRKLGGFEVMAAASGVGAGVRLDVRVGIAPM